MSIRSLAYAVVLAVAGSSILIGTSSQPTYGFGSAPAPKPCVKFKHGTRKWKKCRRKNGLPTSATEQTEELLTLGYTLAISGRYEQALSFLRRAEESNDPRVLTYIGFSERKLGRLDRAMAYYARAIKLDPRNVATLSYMGEAHLQRGELAAANVKLGNIESLCGTKCEPFKALNLAIASYVEGQS